MKRLLYTIFVVCMLGMLTPSSQTYACGGLFCTDTPVDQAAERIIFAVNSAEGTITAYVQINYTGNSDDFSWVVPVPNNPEVNVADMESFNELSTLTAPQITFPPMPDCFEMPMASVSESLSEVDVLQTGSVGPYDYSVIDGDAQEMIDWLKDNGYRITPEMEPLVATYSEEGMVFLAMRLSGDSDVQDIQPIAMTYRAEQPMIPLRLTAVAANPNMEILTWIFADAQAYPSNITRLLMRRNDIAQTDLFGGHNYNELRSGAIDSVNGEGFITEFAQPTSTISSSDPLISSLIEQYPYLTRMYGEMSPEQMTIDPVFEFSTELRDISNIFDLTNRRTQYDCENNVLFSVGHQQLDASKGNRATPEEVTAELKRWPMRILTLVIIFGIGGFIGYQALKQRRRAA